LGECFSIHSKISTGLGYSSIQRKRSDIDIIADILKEAKKTKRKTRIMYSCNLSYKQLEIYLRFLLEVGLLESLPYKRSSWTSFRITSKGLKFLSAYTELKILMS
jgi:predicted transcriptional regulator